MPKALHTAREPNRAAIYARVSDKSQAEEDKTSLAEQTADMEDYCARRGLRIVARYQEVGRGWSKQRPEFQRMLNEAREGRFDVIVCWKSDRLSRGMFPAAALMEVVEAYQLRIESVMDAVDMKTFGLMAAIGKIELDNFRERASMGKRGAAKRGRFATGIPPYGYRVGPDGMPAVDEDEAEVVRRIFRDYVEQGRGIDRIAWDLTDEGVPTATGGRTWHQSVVHQLLGNPVYTGTWSYGRTRNIASDEGTRVFAQPSDTWIEVPVPPLVDAETFARAQAAKRARQSRAKRNTKVLYLLQHLLRCAECGRTFQAKSRWRTHALRKGKRVTYDLAAPYRYYACAGRKLRLRCRESLSIKAERLEGRVWEEVKGVLQQPGVIIAGIEALGQGDAESLAEEQAQAERDLREVQLEEERLVRLYVMGKLSEEMLDAQRKYITERLEHLRARVDDYRTRAATEVTREQLADSVRAWTERVGAGLEALTEEEKRDVLQDVVDEITVDGENNLTITIAIPTDGDEHIAPPVSRNPEGQVRNALQLGRVLESFKTTGLERIVADSNNELVGKALEQLMLGLRPFVASHMDIVLASGTLNANDLQKFAVENRLSPSPNEWDVRGLLRFMDRHWNPVFIEVLERSSRSHVNESIGHRDRWAHQETFSTDDADRAVDTALRLLEAVGAPQSDAVRSIRAELRSRLVEVPRVPTMPRPRAKNCLENCPCWGMPTELPRVCPLCGMQFKVAWTGVDAHYKGRRHESITRISYAEWWSRICQDHGGPA